MLDLELPAQEPAPSDLDSLLAEIDRAVDDCFLAEIAQVLAHRTVGAQADGTGPAA